MFGINIFNGFEFRSSQWLFLCCIRNTPHTFVKQFPPIFIPSTKAKKERYPILAATDTSGNHFSFTLFQSLKVLHLPCRFYTCF